MSGLISPTERKPTYPDYSDPICISWHSTDSMIQCDLNGQIQDLIDMAATFPQAYSTISPVSIKGLTRARRFAQLSLQAREPD